MALCRMTHRASPPQVLVTGGTGFIGSALARRLLADGYQVSLFAREGADRSRLQGAADRVQWLTGDLRDAAAVRAAVEQVEPQAVYHLASTPFNPPTISASEHLATIVGGTVSILEALKDRPGVRVVATGSAAAYGGGSQRRETDPLRPATMLGAAKASASLWLQMYARQYGLQTVELRLFMPYGPVEHPKRLVPHVILSALEGRDIPLTAGDQQRDLVYVDDVVEALRLAGERPLAPGAVFNVGSGVGTPVRLIVERILQLMGRPVKALFGAMPTRPDEIMEMSADIAAARAQLGWAPRTPLDEGLRRTITWWTEHRRSAEQVRDAVGAHA